MMHGLLREGRVFDLTRNGVPITVVSWNAHVCVCVCLRVRAFVFACVFLCASSSAQ